MRASPRDEQASCGEAVAQQVPRRESLPNEQIGHRDRDDHEADDRDEQTPRNWNVFRLTRPRAVKRRRQAAESTRPQPLTPNT